MITRRTFVASAALLATVATTALAGPAESLSKDGDVLLRAIREELARSAGQLRLGELERPYYLEALVVDQVTVELQASFGAVLGTRRSHDRPLRVQARVGSYQLDSSEFVSSSRSRGRQLGSPESLAVEDDLTALRRDLWLAFDGAYKGSLAELAAKRATLQNRLIKEPLPDFSRQEGVVALAPRLDLRLDTGSWEGVLRRLSALFREFPAIQESEVSLRLQVANRYFVSSEGTAVREPASRAMLLARASTQAGDGMVLRDFLPLFAPTAGELPAEAELARLVRTMAQRLSALAAAPVLDEYVGPVLFSDQAAGELVAQVLAPELSGHRPPLFEEEGMAEMIPRSELAERLNRMVLPPFLSVVDDPGTTSIDGKPLIGAYTHDDQGVPGQSVSLVEHGRLKTLLMSRRPRKQIGVSNGHGRVEPFGGVSAHIGNLLVTADDARTEAELKQQLLTLARDAGLSHALLVRRIDDGGVLSGGETSSRSFMLGRPGLGTGLADPIAVYRVSVADGAEELVRGVHLSGITARMLREIVAAGTDLVVDNRLASRSANSFTFFGGAPTDLGVPCAVVAPSLLLPDVEARPRSDEVQRPALLPHPFFEAWPGGQPHNKEAGPGTVSRP